MTREEIQYKIRCCENSISNCNSRIYQLEEDLDSLCDLKTKLDNLEYKIQSDNSSHLTKIINLNSVGNAPRCMTSLCGNINMLLIGREYQDAVQCVEDGKVTVDGKKREIEENIDSLRHEISANYSRIYALRQALNNIKEE